MTNDVIVIMQVNNPIQAVRMRTLAAEMRHHAADTMMPEYREMFARTAGELEEAARRLENRPRFNLAN